MRKYQAVFTDYSHTLYLCDNLRTHIQMYTNQNSSRKFQQHSHLKALT